MSNYDLMTRYSNKSTLLIIWNPPTCYKSKGFLNTHTQSMSSISRNISVSQYIIVSVVMQCLDACAG